MAVIEWDKTGEHIYETGVDHGVLYPQDDNGAYPKGVAWNGLTAVNESPSGAEANPVFADNIKYLNLISAEEYGLTIEAFYSPEEFDACDGTIEIADGVTISQQARQRFGFCYRTRMGNDVKGDEYGYKLHIAYGCSATPSEKNHATVNDSPEASALSWTVNTTPVNVENHRPTACVTIDSTKATKAQMEAIEAALYGTADKEAYLPTPDQIATIMNGAK